MLGEVEPMSAVNAVESVAKCFCCSIEADTQGDENVRIRWAAIL